jgi:hypothetical protein
MEASVKKDINALEDIRSSLIDVGLLSLCNEKITELRKK